MHSPRSLQMHEHWTHCPNIYCSKWLQNDYSGLEVMVDPTSYIKHLMFIMRTSYNLPCDENISVLALSTTLQQVHVMLQTT